MNLFSQFVAIGSLFKSMPMFRRVIVATVIMFFQQWTGINAILYYAPKIFNGLGLSSNAVSLLATGVVGIVMFIVRAELQPQKCYANLCHRLRYRLSCGSINGAVNQSSSGVLSAWPHVT